MKSVIECNVGYLWICNKGTNVSLILYINFVFPHMLIPYKVNACDFTSPSYLMFLLQKSNKSLERY